MQGHKVVSCLGEEFLLKRQTTRFDEKVGSFKEVVLLLDLEDMIFKEFFQGVLLEITNFLGG